MSTIFSKIVSGEIPAYKVAESNDFLAFLDVRPIAEGHVLVIPKRETDYIFDIADEEYMSLWIFAKIVAQGLKKAVPCVRIGVAVVGMEVAHAHIHLVPMHTMADLDFGKPKLQYSEEEFVALSERIRDAISTITNQ